jgi:putative NADH-flavin reductase
MEQGLSRGHKMTALLRSTAPLRPRARLRIAFGDPLQADTLISAISGQDLVISCLGQRGRSDSKLLQHAASAMISAMARGEARRYLVISQALLFPTHNPLVALLRLALSRYVADSAAMENIVTKSDTDWTIVRPTRLLGGVASRGYRVQVGGKPPGPSSIQRIDLAAFLLDEAEKCAYRKATVGVTSA